MAFSVADPHDAVPMRRCSACVHPDRAAIDADLAAGLSLRTVAGRHGLSASAVHRHLTRHLEEPTVGEIREADEGAHWQQWDGRRWVDIKMPNIVDDLIKLKRSDRAGYRLGWTKLRPDARDDQLYPFIRNVYRLRSGAKIIRLDGSPANALQRGWFVCPASVAPLIE